jgi:hypothetical protein
LIQEHQWRSSDWTSPQDWPRESWLCRTSCRWYQGRFNSEERSSEVDSETAPLTTCVFVVSITDEFVLGLDVLRIHDASLDLGRRMLWMKDKVPLWRSLREARPEENYGARDEQL